jgi:hypothetical protein
MSAYERSDQENRAERAPTSAGERPGIASGAKGSWEGNTKPHSHLSGCGAFASQHCDTHCDSARGGQQVRCRTLTLLGCTHCFPAGAPPKHDRRDAGERRPQRPRSAASAGCYCRGTRRPPLGSGPAWGSPWRTRCIRSRGGTLRSEDAYAYSTHSPELHLST